MAMIFTPKRYRAQSAKGNGAWGEVQGKQAQASKGHLPVKPHRTPLIPSVVTTHVKHCEPGKLVRDSAHGFYWGLVM